MGQAATEVGAIAPQRGATLVIRVEAHARRALETVGTFQLADEAPAVRLRGLVWVCAHRWHAAEAPHADGQAAYRVGQRPIGVDVAHQERPGLIGRDAAVLRDPVHRAQCDLERGALPFASAWAGEALCNRQPALGRKSVARRPRLAAAVRRCIRDSTRLSSSRSFQGFLKMP